MRLAASGFVPELMFLASGWQQGGQSGAAVIPGKPEESLLIAAVTRTKADYEMPPDGPLPADEVATLVEWVARGAHDPRTTTTSSMPSPRPTTTHSEASS